MSQVELLWKEQLWQAHAAPASRSPSIVLQYAKYFSALSCDDSAMNWQMSASMSANDSLPAASFHRVHVISASPANREPKASRGSVLKRANMAENHRSAIACRCCGE